MADKRACNANAQSLARLIRWKGRQATVYFPALIYAAWCVSGSTPHPHGQRARFCISPSVLKSTSWGRWRLSERCAAVRKSSAWASPSTVRIPDCMLSVRSWMRGIEVVINQSQMWLSAWRHSRYLSSSFFPLSQSWSFRRELWRQSLVCVVGVTAPVLKLSDRPVFCTGIGHW